MDVQAKTYGRAGEDVWTCRQKRMNDILTQVKAAYTVHKMVIKNNYAPEQWAAYGVPDKR